MPTKNWTPERIAHRKERQSANNKRYYAEHREEEYERVQEWRKANRSKVLEWRKQDWKKRYARQAEIECARIAEWKKLNKNTIAIQSCYDVIIEKLALIDGYGGKCACCGEDRFEFLTLDHINGWGSRIRKTTRVYGRGLYKRLRHLGYPKDAYRLLCMNCNFSHGRYGFCPHQFEQREYGLSAC